MIIIGFCLNIISAQVFVSSSFMADSALRRRSVVYAVRRPVRRSTESSHWFRVPKQTEGPLLGPEEIWATLGLPTAASLQATGGRSATGGPDSVLPKVYRVGSVCSGMMTETWAFERLPWKFQHVFWCEKADSPRKFIRDNIGHLGSFKLMSNHRTNYGL